MGSAAYITEATYSLPVQIALQNTQGYTVMTKCITSLHLVTLPYEMAVITITWWEIRTPYQAADRDRLV